MKNGAKSIFGNDFSKQFNKEGTEDIIYNAENDKYYCTSIELDEEEDRYIINSIDKDKNEYRVEIIEYLEDYTDTMNIENGMIHVKNLNNITIFDVGSSEDEASIIDKVKETKDSFDKKVINLTRDKEGNVFVKSVEK